MSKRGSLGSALKGVDRVLMITGPSMDLAETTFPFGLMHKRVEEYLESSGLDWTHLRPTGFMQEYLREAPSIIHDGALYFALGDVKLNPIDLVDVAKVGFLLLRDGGHEGERLPMTGPEALSMTEIADRISRANGTTVRYVAVPPIARRQALIAHGIPPEFADALDRQVEERLKGGLESQVNLSTHRLFNVKPTTFSEFALRNANAFGGAAAAA
jgi:uncharacterized protein YbjT (DUF2867 family)